MLSYLTSENISYLSPITFFVSYLLLSILQIAVFPDKNKRTFCATFSAKRTTTIFNNISLLEKNLFNR